MLVPAIAEVLAGLIVRVAGHPDAAGARGARLGRRGTDTVHDAQ